MEIDATAQALVADEALPDATPTQDDELSSAYDRLTAEEPVQDETANQPDIAEAEPAPVEVAVPTDIPSALKAHWGTLPEDARTAIVSSQREMASKVAQMGRETAAMRPVRDALTGFVKDYPSLAEMTPAQFLDELKPLAQANQAFNDDPVKAVMGLIKQHGLESAVGSALQGQPGDTGNTVALKNEIKQLKGHIERLSDPNALRENFDTWSAEKSAVSQVQEFAKTAEHWGDVETHMPHFIPISKAKLGDSASAQDVLADAYKLAVSYYVPKAQDQAAQAAETQPDPERAKAALAAKSVNVNGAKTGKARDLTQDEIMSQTYDRLMRS
jgi:hypothetical protein